MVPDGRAFISRVPGGSAPSRTGCTRVSLHPLRGSPRASSMTARRQQALLQQRGGTAICGRRRAIPGAPDLRCATCGAACRTTNRSLLRRLGCPGRQSFRSGAPLDTATFAGGCFWCVEEAFDKVEGVVSTTTSGYTGGRTQNPTYEQVITGRTGHAEVVQVLYSPQKISYAELLNVFWKNIDPFTPNRQFCDTGSQVDPRSSLTARSARWPRRPSGRWSGPDASSSRSLPRSWLRRASTPRRSTTRTTIEESAPVQVLQNQLRSHNASQRSGERGRQVRGRLVQCVDVGPSAREPRRLALSGHTEADPNLRTAGGSKRMLTDLI